jgi:hypothetical protein
MSLLNAKTIGIGVVGLLIAGAIIVPRWLPVDDQALIKDALAESIKAGREGRPNGVLELLSRNFQVNEESPGSRDIAQYIRQYKPDFVVQNQNPVVTGANAVIVSPVRVQSNILGQKLGMELPSVTLRFEKQDTMSYFVIPTRKWQLIKVEVAPDAWAQAIGMGMMGGG